MDCFDGNDAWTWLCQEASLTRNDGLNVGYVGLGKYWILWIWLYLIGNTLSDLVAHCWFSLLQAIRDMHLLDVIAVYPKRIWIR